MRLLVLSNVPGSVDRVVSAVQQNNRVIAKEVNATTDAIANTVGEEIRNGTYDQVIVVAKDPIRAGILLNKQEDVEAAVCSSLEDVQSARNSGVNAIVIKDIHSSELDEMVSEIAESGSVAQRIRSGIKTPAFVKRQEQKRVEKDKKEYDRSSDSESDRYKKNGEESEAEEDEEGEERLAAASSKRSGLMGKLKDALGIL